MKKVKKINHQTAKASLPDRLDTFFKKNPVSMLGKNIHLLVIRRDGHVLFNQGDAAPESDMNSIGALISGAWQAVGAVSSFIPTLAPLPDEGFRLSFDLASKGVYIVPVSTPDGECYLASLFLDAINPALLKNKIRILAKELEKNIRSTATTATTAAPRAEEEVVTEDDFLFKGISDAEIDDLFSLVSV